MKGQFEQVFVVDSRALLHTLGSERTADPCDNSGVRLTSVLPARAAAASMGRTCGASWAARRGPASRTDGLRAAYRGRSLVGSYLGQICHNECVCRLSQSAHLVYVTNIAGKLTGISKDQQTSIINSLSRQLCILYN